MAVYTDVTVEELEKFLAGYDLGELRSYKGIAEGVENSNFPAAHHPRLFHSDALRKACLHARPAVLPGPDAAPCTPRGLNCPQPVARSRWRGAGQAGEAASGHRHVPRKASGCVAPQAWHCNAVGEALAKLHLAGVDFPMRRKNGLAVAGWSALYSQAAARADGVHRNLSNAIAAELDNCERHWPQDLPEGCHSCVIFFRTMFFFLDNELSGLIDFYFALHRHAGL